MNSKFIKKSILSLILVSVLALNIFIGTFAQVVEVPPAEMYAAKQYAFDWLKEHNKTYTNMSDAVWSYAELGMQEFRTSKLVSDHLEKAGFKVERGAAGMPTCFVATWGSGEPVIGFMGELDALPMLSQKAGVAEHDPVVEGAPGHGCGHNHQAPSAAAAAIATKLAMEKFGIKGTIKVYGAPAEETIVSRPYMVRDGLFDGVSAVLGNHGGSRFGGGTLGGISGGNAVFSTEFHFHGTTAHSGSTPWFGRSALDAIELMDHATNMMREHLTIGQRMHYVITKGGEAPNVVPDEATVWYFVRHRDAEIVPMYEWVQQCAQAAAMATQTTVEERLLSAVHQSVGNAPLTKLAHQNCMLVGLPKWSEEEENFARKLQKELGVPETGMAKELGVLREYVPVTLHTGGGSSDVAEVSRITAYVTISIPSQIPGSISHHWSTTVGNIGTQNDKALLVANQAMAGTALDMFTKPDVLKEITDYTAYNTKTYGEYKPYIPADVKPPVDLNRELMEKYRPLMERYYIEFTEEIF